MIRRERFPDDYFNLRKPCESIEGYRKEHGNLLCVIALRLNPRNYLPRIDGDLESTGNFMDLYGIQLLTTRSEDLKNVSLWDFSTLIRKDTVMSKLFLWEFIGLDSLQPCMTFLLEQKQSEFAKYLYGIIDDRVVKYADYVREFNGLRITLNKNGAELHTIDAFEVPDIQKLSNLELLALSNKNRDDYGLYKGWFLHKVLDVTEIAELTKFDLNTLSNEFIGHWPYKVLDVPDLAKMSIVQLVELLGDNNKRKIHVIGIPAIETIASLNIAELVALLDENNYDKAQRTSQAKTKKVLEKKILDFETGLEKWRSKLYDIQRIKRRIENLRIGHLDDLRKYYKAQIDGVYEDELLAIFDTFCDELLDPVTSDPRSSTMERAQERLSFRWKNGITNYAMQLRRRVAFEKQQNSEKRKRRKLDLSSLSSSVKSPSSSDSKVDESEEEKEQYEKNVEKKEDNNVNEGKDVFV